MIREPTDAIVRVTLSVLCGSDLHLYEVLGPFLDPGDILGHEPTGVVEAVGTGVHHIAVGDRVVVPFNISCGRCFMCDADLQTQCETTQVRERGSGAALFGYTKLYGQVAGGQAEYLRVPTRTTARFRCRRVRLMIASSCCPTFCRRAGRPSSTRSSRWRHARGHRARPDRRDELPDAALRGVSRIIGVGLVPERLQRVASRGVDVFDFSTFDDQADLVAAIRDETNGRGPDSVIDAVGMEAHGSSGAAFAQKLTGMLPDGVAERLMKTAGIDRLAAFQLAVELVRRGGTISPSGVYGGMADPPPMLVMFDKLMHLRMGQVNVRRWTHLILPLLVDADPLGVDSFVTHHLTLEAAPDAYSSFQKKQDGMIKVMFQP